MQVRVLSPLLLFHRRPGLCDDRALRKGEEILRTGAQADLRELERQARDVQARVHGLLPPDSDRRATSRTNASPRLVALYSGGVAAAIALGVAIGLLV